MRKCIEALHNNHNPKNSDSDCNGRDISMYLFRCPITRSVRDRFLPELLKG